MWQKLLKIFAAKNSKNAASIFDLYKKKLIIGAIFSALPTLLVILVVFIVLYGPIMMSQQYIEDSKNEVAYFFEKVGNVLTLKGWCSDSDGSCQKKAEQKYYEQLNIVYNEYKQKGVEIDTQLITGTILYDKILNDDTTYLDDTNSSLDTLTEDYSDIKLGDIKKLASKMVSGNRINYDIYRKYLENTYVEKRFKNLYDSDEKKKKIIDEIMMFASFETKVKNNNGVYYGSCSYNVTGNEVNTSEIDVVLLSCDGQRELERVDFEKYIKGVVYGEIGYSWNEEVLKSQAIATRSFTLTRNETMCPGRPNNCEYGYNPNTNEIRMRNCEADQVYCDYTQGCQQFEFNGYRGLISGTINPNYNIYKNALSENEIIEFENKLNEVQGLVLMNQDNTIYAAGYIDNDQNAWNSMYMADNTLDYNEILIKHYWRKTNSDLTISGNCRKMTGEFTKWKQTDEKWFEVNIGNDTMGNSGCLVTSISIQIARSGTVDLQVFNPGVFANELSARNSFSESGILNFEPLKTTVKEITNGRFSVVNPSVFLEGSKYDKLTKLQEYINQGYFLVISVYNGGHYVAVDRIENGKLYIFDPGYDVNELEEKYLWDGVDNVKIFKVSQ